MHDRLIGVIEADVRRVQVLSGERRCERLELLGWARVLLVGNLYLELRLLSSEVVRLLKVIDARQLEEDLVLAHRLDHRLRDAEAVDATVDHAPRAVVVVGDALAGRDLAGVHLEEELGPALEVKPEVGLDLLVDLDRAQVEADAGAGRWKRERELMFRDVEEDRQHEDHEDEPGEGAVHKKSLEGNHTSRRAFRRSRASRISRSNGVSPSIGAAPFVGRVAGIDGTGAAGAAASAALSSSLSALRNSSRS